MHDLAPLTAYDAELRDLRAAVLVLSIALACATQPSVGAVMWRKLRPPISEDELQSLAAVWVLEPASER